MLRPHHVTSFGIMKHYRSLVEPPLLERNERYPSAVRTEAFAGGELRQAARAIRAARLVGGRGRRHYFLRRNSHPRQEIVDQFQPHGARISLRFLRREFFARTKRQRRVAQFSQNFPRQLAESLLPTKHLRNRH